MKSLEELKSGESAWNRIQKIIDSAENKYEILPADSGRADEVLELCQLPLSSLEGAVVHETGGILIDGGWLRVIGSGSEKLKRDMFTWSIEYCYGEEEEETEEEIEPGFLVVGDDVLGGIFALNNGELGDDEGNIYYLAPDTLEWEPLEVGYEGFIKFCFNGSLNDFYGNFRWEGWQDEIKNMSGDEAILVNPPLWAEGPDNVNERQRTAVSVVEMYNALAAASELLDGEFDDDCGCDDDDCDCDDDDCGCGDDDCGCGDDDCDCEDDDCGCGDDDNCCGGGCGCDCEDDDDCDDDDECCGGEEDGCCGKH